MLIPCRFVEACALLPMLHVTSERPNTVLCLGTHAEKFAADCLRHRDVSKVHLLAPPVTLKDKRLEIGMPATGSCAAVLTSPDEPSELHINTLRPDGVLCASTLDPSRVPVMMRMLRNLFPRAVSPWRDYLPEPIYGVLASPRGAPQRLRDPPMGAKHLSKKYLPCLFTFAADETPLVFGPQEATPTPSKSEASRAQPAVPSR